MNSSKKEKLELYPTNLQKINYEKLKQFILSKYLEVKRVL